MESPQNIELRINGEIVYSSTGSKVANASIINKDTNYYTLSLYEQSGTLDEKLIKNNMYIHKGLNGNSKLGKFINFKFKIYFDTETRFGSIYKLICLINFDNFIFEVFNLIDKTEYINYQTNKTQLPTTLSEFISINTSHLTYTYNELLKHIYNYNEKTDNELRKYTREMSWDQRSNQFINGGSRSRKLKKSKKNIKSKTKVKSKSKRK